MRSALLPVFLALYGCASAPAYQPTAVALPPAFQEARVQDRPAPYVAIRDTVPGAAEAPTPTPVEYWRELGDTTLSRLVEEVANSNLDLAAARSRVSAERSERNRALLDLTPSATFAGSYSRQRLSAAGFPGASGPFPDQNVWQAGFDASWELDVFGRLQRSVQAHGALVGAAEASLRDATVSLTAELARAYFELRGAQEQLAVARRNAENQRQTMLVAQERLDAGQGTAFDTDRAQAQLSSTLASIPEREARVAAAQYRIGVLVGRSPTEVARELETPAALPALPDVVPVDNPDSVVRYRPDVAAAERMAAARHAQVGAAKAEYLPRITIGGAAGYSSAAFNSLGNDGTFRYAVGPVITWPGLNLGRVRAAVQTSEAQEEEARSEYRRTVLQAVQEMETALANYRAARRRVARLEEASAASGRAADLARLRFKEGVTDFLQVLDAERTQLAAEDLLAQGRIDAATAYAALYKAMGGR